jgi:hypothetical protein
MSWRGIHTGQQVAHNNRIADEVVDFHGFRRVIEAEIRAGFNKKLNPQPRRSIAEMILCARNPQGHRSNCSQFNAGKSRRSKGDS